MHISKLDPQNTGQELTYTIRFTRSEAPPGFEATMDALMDAVEFHYSKAKDYDGAEEEFGMKGEIIGITRKVRKLKSILWDGKDPIFEGAQEMLMDLIGNSLLTLRMQKKVSDKYSANWRTNRNKPTFGPNPARLNPGDRKEYADLGMTHLQIPMNTLEEPEEELEREPGNILSPPVKLEPGAVRVSRPEPARVESTGVAAPRPYGAFPRRAIRDNPQA